MLQRRPIGLFVLMALAACEIPTEPPVVVQRWVLPVETTFLGVGELLPPGVSVQDGSFAMDLDPASVSASLGELCSACAPLDGAVVASMPPFTGRIGTTGSLSAGVEEVEVTTGPVRLQVHNDLSFDPIEGGGTLTLSVSDASTGDVLAEIVLDGSTTVLDPGTTVTRTVDVDPGTLGATYSLEAEMISVGGQSATIDLEDEITVTLSSATLQLGSVTFDVGTTEVDFDAVEIDVADFSDSLTDRILEGSVLLDVVNPFAVSVDGDLGIGDTSRSFVIEPSGSSKLRLGYTGDELRTFLGSADVVLSATGTATGGSITVTPDQDLTMDASLDVLLEVGEGGGGG